MPDIGTLRPQRSQIPLAPMPQGRLRGQSRQAPSQVEETAKVRLTHLLRAGRDVAMDRGTLIHTWFEQIQWLDVSRPTEAQLRLISKQLGVSPRETDLCLPQFQAMLRQPAIAWTLSRRSYQPPRDLPLTPEILADLANGTLDFEVLCERRFAVPDGEQVLSGSIDRLVLIRRGLHLLAADILDFKTDALDVGASRESVAEKSAHYRSQLTGYARAVAAMYQLPRERIASRLLFLSSGHVEAVK